MSERSLRWGIALAGIVLLFTVGLGFAVIYADRDAGEELIRFISDELYAGLMGNDPFVVFVQIFLNNLQACAILFLGGASLGLFTILIIAVNGLLIGGVVAYGVQEKGVTYIMAALLPHGLLEIPAFILSGALGLMLARSLWMEWKEGCDASEALKGLGEIFIQRIIPLLTIAAFIEAFITPYVIELMI